MQRWDPWRDILSLREAMNSLLEESFVRPRAELEAMTSGMPLDLRETDDGYVVEMVLPGVKQEDVHISVLGDQLRIRAEAHEGAAQQEARWLIRERRYGVFERALTLPSRVRADDAQASFEDGILTIVLPTAREIQIGVRDPGSGVRENREPGGTGSGDVGVRGSREPEAGDYGA